MGNPIVLCNLVIAADALANPVAPLDGRVRPERRPAGS